MMTIATMMPGIDTIASTSRITTQSHQPPR